jgi:hypothetical protein
MGRGVEGRQAGNESTAKMVLRETSGIFKVAFHGERSLTAGIPWKKHQRDDSREHIDGKLTERPIPLQCVYLFIFDPHS